MIYIRVSTAEQVENMSLETQAELCRNYCLKRGWPVVRLFREEGQSAKSTRRDEFQLMLRFCKDKKNAVGYIIVYDLSRFARNMLDQLSTEKDLLESGVRLVSVLEPTEDSAAGRLSRNILAVMHQFDNDRRAERTVAGMTQGAKSGRFMFKAPIGYINVSQKQGKNLIPDPKTAPLIMKGFELFATGLHQKTEVLKQLNSMGLTTHQGHSVSTQTFDRMLVNPVYAGWVTIPKWGMRFQGNFEPIVSQSVFDAVQDVLEGRKIVAKAYERNNSDFPLRVFARCAVCGEPLTGGWSTGKRKKYAYYRCRQSGCGLNNIRRDDLQSKFIALLKRLTSAQDVLSECMEAVRDEWKKRQGDSEAAYAAIQKRLERLRQRKNRLVDLRLDEELNETAFAEQDKRLTADIEAAEMELRQTESEFLDLEGVLAFAEKVFSACPSLDGIVSRPETEAATVVFPKWSALRRRGI